MKIAKVTMYYIQNVSYAAFVVARTDRRGNQIYSGMGARPTMFPNRAAAQAITRDYRACSKNSGKTPSKLMIRKVEVGGDPA